MLIQEQNTKRAALVYVAVMTNYVEDPKTVIGHSLQLKNATRFFFFFDIVIYPYNMQRVYPLYTYEYSYIVYLAWEQQDIVKKIMSRVFIELLFTRKRKLYLYINPSGYIAGI